MKRKMAIAVFGALVLLGALAIGVTRLSTMIFGQKVVTICNTKVVESISLDDGKATVTIVDDMCDSGLVVSGVFKVILRYREQGRIAETLLLAANNMRSDARTPEVKVLGAGSLLIIGQKDLVVTKGPAEVAGIHFTYELK